MQAEHTYCYINIEDRFSSILKWLRYLFFFSREGMLKYGKNKTSLWHQKVVRVWLLQHCVLLSLLHWHHSSKIQFYLLIYTLLVYPLLLRVTCFYLFLNKIIILYSKLCLQQLCRNLLLFQVDIDKRLLKQLRQKNWKTAWDTTKQHIVRDMG